MIASKTSQNIADAPHGGVVHPLKALDAQQFAALGGSHVVFTRTISGAALSIILPEAASMPESATFHLVMAANGVPMMVSDNAEALLEWIDENEVEVAPRH